MMRKFVFKIWSASGLAGIVFPMQPAGASIVTAQASAEVISPADVSAQVDTQLLLSSTPGVLILTIPGSAGFAASSIELTATGAQRVRPLVFKAYNQNGQTMAQLVPMATQASAGVLNGQGVQIAVLMPAPSADGSGPLAVTITFD